MQLSTSKNLTKLSYTPIPMYDDQKRSRFNLTSNSKVQHKLDLNLHCIKNPQKTFCIHTTNPNFVMWGIQAGDILVVEQSMKIDKGDLIVVNNQVQQSIDIYECFSLESTKIRLLPLDTTKQNLTITDISQIDLLGIVTNVIHQVRKF